MISDACHLLLLSSTDSRSLTSLHNKKKNQSPIQSGVQ
jgi:hypothetical protein